MTSANAKYKGITTEDGGRQNIFSIEPQIQVVDQDGTYWQRAELLNGRLAMIGLVAAVTNYSIFGWIIPGFAQAQTGLYQFYSYYKSKKMTPEAEKFNGWMAMIGFVAAIGAYVTTGQIIPGIF